MPQHTLPAFPFLFSFLQQYCTVADHCPVSLILLNLVDCCCDCRCRSGINDNIIDISIEHILYCQRTTLISYAFCRKSREIPFFASFNIILSCCSLLNTDLIRLFQFCKFAATSSALLQSSNAVSLLGTIRRWDAE